ncbi:MAG: family NAD(P)-dependent oxidoreductase [Gemmatimonadetes bacterium]|jgi:short-subunit dehydrogenase|nr:family NAD(P)-dependent oxidoreductase [Gemmatimonadota bacterium]
MQDNGSRPLALVTGASSGIGADLARELARHGHDVVLTARRAPELEALAVELRALGAVATVMPKDISVPGAARELAREIDLRGLRIDVLINNAGFGDVGPFVREDPDRIDAMLQVNVAAPTALTRAILPGMIARRRGRVMLVSSTAAFQPGPNMATYCATKAYVLSLGEALARELRGTGVTLTTLCPGATHTGFAAESGAESLPLFSSRLVPKMSSANVARAGYDAMMRGKPVLVTGFVNKLVAFSGRVFPRAVVFPVAKMLLGDHAN